MDKRSGALGIRRLPILNKALCVKWLWRFGCESESIWKRLVSRKDEEEEGDWSCRGAREGYGDGVWKAIRSGWESFESSMIIKVENGLRVMF